MHILLLLYKRDYSQFSINLFLITALYLNSTYCIWFCVLYWEKKKQAFVEHIGAFVWLIYTINCQYIPFWVLYTKFNLIYLHESNTTINIYILYAFHIIRVTFYIKFL